MSDTNNSGLTAYNPTAANGKARKHFNDSGVDDLKISYESGERAKLLYPDVIADARKKLEGK
jgi:hypothetical protein